VHKAVTVLMQLHPHRSDKVENIPFYLLRT